MRCMLSNPVNSHGIRNRPGSPIFLAFYLAPSSSLLVGNGIDALGTGRSQLGATLRFRIWINESEFEQQWLDVLVLPVFSRRHRVLCHLTS
ncbi:hypothetical protein Tco_1476965 [Tanacetum coccineum]